MVEWLVWLMEIGRSFVFFFGTQNVACLLDCLRLLTETPLCFPRFFFQTLQSTQIKLAVSPQPRVPGEPVTTTIGAQLAVKVEGIVQVVAIRSSSLVEI